MITKSAWRKRIWTAAVASILILQIPAFLLPINTAAALGYLPVQVFLHVSSTTCNAEGTLSGFTEQSGNGDVVCNHNMQFSGQSSSSITMNPLLTPVETEQKIGELDSVGSSITESFNAEASAQSDAFCDASGNCSLENGFADGSTSNFNLAARNSNPFPVTLQETIKASLVATCAGLAVGQFSLSPSGFGGAVPGQDADCSTTTPTLQETDSPVNFVQTIQVPANGEIDIGIQPTLFAQATAQSNNGVTTLGKATNSASGTFGFTLSASSTSTVPSATGAGSVMFSTGAGTLSGLAAIPQAALSPSPPAGSYPFGFFSWSITGFTPATPVTITATFPSPVPAGTQYLKLVGGTWVSVPITISGNTITMTIQDNGPFDADPTVGTISDPGGIGTLSSNTIPEFPFSYSLVIIFVAVAAVYLAIRQKMTIGFKRF
jgi:hypothetical protein